MPAILLQPSNREGGELMAGLGGSEWFEFDAVLDKQMHIRIENHNRRFPECGLVSLRCGYDHSDTGERITDEFRYEERRTDETGAAIPDTFKVTLFLEESAFDRLMARIHWGLPDVVLHFDLSAEMVTFDMSDDPNDLVVNLDRRVWEKVASATLRQRPWR